MVSVVTTAVRRSRTDVECVCCNEYPDDSYNGSVAARPIASSRALTSSARDARKCNLELWDRRRRYRLGLSKGCVNKAVDFVATPDGNDLQRTVGGGEHFELSREIVFRTPKSSQTLSEALFDRVEGSRHDHTGSDGTPDVLLAVVPRFREALIGRRARYRLVIVGADSHG
jgi:hypothetical protein